MPKLPSISVSGRTYARVRAASSSRGVTMRSLLEQALGLAVTSRAKPRTRSSIEIRVESAQSAWARRHREKNAAAGLCLNENRAGTHGKATHGELCRACREVHRGSPRELPIAAIVARVFAAMPVVAHGTDVAQRAGAARRISALRHATLARVHGITVDERSGLYVRKARVA